jgi:hypothetical protein
MSFLKRIFSCFFKKKEEKIVVITNPVIYGDM